MSASAAIAEVLNLLAGEPAFIAGSSVAAEIYGNDEFNDVDVFVPTDTVLMTTVQILLDQGCTLAPEFERTLGRWKEFGVGTWQTNSIRLISPSGVEINVIYKKEARQPTRTLLQVLETFDFGFLLAGYDVRTGEFRDLRDYYFRNYGSFDRLPMHPDRKAKWVRGYFSEHIGDRQCGRYAKFMSRGYDLSLCTDDLATGYRMAATYYSTKDDPAKQFRSELYLNIHEALLNDDIDQLLTFDKAVRMKTPHDEIMELFT